MSEWDVIVLGAGPAGEVVAGRLADAGRSVVIVERELVGGECAFWACMPSKALLRPGELLDEVARVPGAHEALAPGGGVDAEAALRRRDEVIHDLDDAGQLPWLEHVGVELIRGHGRLTSEPRTVVVDDRRLTARVAVVVATGTGALIPPIPGLREAAPWTNREATTAKHVPQSLLILGGGVVGVEMAQAWATLGSRVVLVEALPRLLSREEPFAGEQVADSLRERGAEVRLGQKAARVSGSGDGFELELEDGTSLVGQELLVAIGRTPHTDDIGLEHVAGLEPGSSIEVDSAMRVDGKDWLYAIGDVNGRSLLTHMGKYQARIAAENILGGNARATQDGPHSPRVVFTDPQVAATGLTLELAREQGLEVRAVDVPTAASAGASFYGRNAPGTARIVVDEQRKVLVGATFTGPEIGDFIHAATIAIVGEVPLERLWHAVPSFPTRSELWLKLLEEYGL